MSVARGRFLEAKIAYSVGEITGDVLVCLLALHLPITSRQDLPLLNNPSNITIQGYIVYSMSSH